MQNAIRAGVDTIEHGVFLDDETADLMARRGTTFVPTLVATQLFEPRADHPEIPDYVREKAAVTVPAHRDNFPRAVHAGVTIAAGTDAGSTFVDHGLVALQQHRWKLQPDLGRDLGWLPARLGGRRLDDPGRRDGDERGGVCDRDVCRNGCGRRRRSVCTRDRTRHRTTVSTTGVERDADARRHSLG